MTHEPSNESRPPIESRDACLKAFSEDIDLYFRRLNPLSRVPNTHRILAFDAVDDKPCLIVARDYMHPLSETELDAQKQSLEIIRGTTSPHACRLKRYRLEASGHYLVSELTGTQSVSQLLRQERKFELEKVVELLRELATGLEVITRHGWPRIELDLNTLFLSDRDDKTEIPITIPPLPGMETVAGGQGFHGCSSGYVDQLAKVACNLLGMPSSAKNFHPFPDIGSHRNRLLEQIVNTKCGALFESITDFVDNFEDGTVPDPVENFDPQTSPLPVRTSTSTQPIDPPAKEPASPPALPPDETNHPDPRPPVSPPPPPSEEETAPGIACDKLRLIPSSLERGITGLIATDDLRIGRSGTADFVVQFLPRNPKNNELTNMVSREHLVLSKRDDVLEVEETSDTNQSFVGGTPIHRHQEIIKDCFLLVAGEYELNLRFTASSMGKEERILHNPQSEGSRNGALVLSPGKLSQSLNYSTAWIFTDIRFGIDPEGKLILAPKKTDVEVLGLFLRRESGVYVIAMGNKRLVSINGVTVEPGDPVLLPSDSQLKIGDYTWQTKPYAK